ncbi:histidine decarboxylase [Merismopedia glauca]|uniref:Histidine decarboxylase n=1 Tax=Merismopedia glauca CCAP 1448/3 TaxID=1296344 RepID=A0A2T1C0X1_9CYAN|nr:histidine decarboxylase [Merismopedia glauca]PSB01910.1 histidine decarboxylase [Merismopedia glauca CCAP 1448/3]
MNSRSLFEHELSPDDQTRLDRLYEYIQAEAQRFIGYPCNGVFDYTPLFRFLQYPLNNIGDPYLPSNYHLNTHAFECEVLEIFQKLTDALPGSTWGYVTNGGTEGNHYGLFLARELLPGGLVYYSQDAHYSIDKILRCLNLRSIMIRSHPDGRMDLEDLRETLRIHRDISPIICATIGTTMKGAVDDIAGIQTIFRDLAIHRHYIHADAALGGMILPFVDNPPPWNFKAGIDSIAISGHKMVGSPIPCGVVLAKKSHVDRIAQSVEYIDTLDTTLSGSRNAVTPLFLWYAFHTVGIEGFKRIIPACLQIADYAIAQLQKINRHPWRYPYSNTVVFDRPSPDVTRYWQLACQGNLSHLITMPHVTSEHIDRLLADIEAADPIIPLTAPSVMPACELVSSIPDRDITLVGTANNNLLAEVSAALAAEGLSIEGLTAAAPESEDVEVVRLRVNDRDRALQILNQNLDIGRCYGQADPFQEASQVLSQLEYQSVSEDALLVQLEDRPGALAELLKSCLGESVKIRSLRVLWRGHGKGVVAIATTSPKVLKELLKDRILLS